MSFWKIFVNNTQAIVNTQRQWEMAGEMSFDTDAVDLATFKAKVTALFA